MNSNIKNKVIVLSIFSKSNYFAEVLAPILCGYMHKNTSMSTKQYFFLLNVSHNRSYLKDNNPKSNPFHNIPVRS